MFEKALITAISDDTVDLGLVAETILFYQSTQLLLNGGTIAGLARLLPREQLIDLLDRSNIRLSYLRPIYAVHTTGPFGKAHFVPIEFHGDKKKRISFTDELDILLSRNLGASVETKKLCNTICDRTALYRELYT